MLADRISDVYKRISRAALRAGREADEVLLVAVTKTVDAATVAEAVDSGLRVFGENRVQEAQQKSVGLAALRPDSPLCWHLIGHLQKNKAKHAAALFSLIHSVDSAELARELDRQAAAAGKVQDILLQVKLAEEETKHGVAGADLFSLLEAAGGCTHLRVRGLMTMPPFFDDPAAARPYFRRLRELRDKAESAGYRLPELSMGMSGDFEIAIEEGATMVRIGTHIFGERVCSRVPRAPAQETAGQVNKRNSA